MEQKVLMSRRRKNGNTAGPRFVLISNSYYLSRPLFSNTEKLSSFSSVFPSGISEFVGMSAAGGIVPTGTVPSTCWITL